MYAKVISFGLIALLAAITSVTRWTPFVKGKDVIPSVLSVPAIAGGWHRTGAWAVPHGTNFYQENLGYEQQGWVLTASVDHDFKHSYNAVNCFVGKGELLDASWVRTLKTRDGSAQFNLAQLKTESSIAVVAATQCRANACIENPPALVWTDLAHFDFWKSFVTQPSNALNTLALNISITRADAAADPKNYAEMEAALASFVENLDLSPLRKAVADEDAAIR